MFFKSFYLFIFFSFLIHYFIIRLNKNNKLFNLRVCVCTLGKEENRYIAEFVEHYKNYGVDKIYLYDNNDINGERYDKVIRKYIRNKFVEVIDWRGVKGTSTYYGILNSCYKAFHDQYDWLIFYEIDEFLFLKNYTNVKEYLLSPNFNNCESIQLNWVHMSDNNHIFYTNKPLKERFPTRGKNVVKNRYNKICFVKTMVRGHLKKKIEINQNHLISSKLKSCDGFGNKGRKKIIKALNPDYEFNYIMHYYTKSLQEFVEKINRGDLLRGNSKEIIEWAVEKFFYINQITEEKIRYIQNKLGSKYKLNLSKYWKN